MRIILIRHGETTWNIEGRYQGQEDTPLSERGRKQGLLLAEALRREGFTEDEVEARPACSHRRKTHRNQPRQLGGRARRRYRQALSDRVCALAHAAGEGTDAGRRRKP